MKGGPTPKLEQKPSVGAQLLCPVLSFLLVREGGDPQSGVHVRLVWGALQGSDYPLNVFEDSVC